MLTAPSQVIPKYHCTLLTFEYARDLKPDVITTWAICEQPRSAQEQPSMMLIYYVQSVEKVSGMTVNDVISTEYAENI